MATETANLNVFVLLLFSLVCVSHALAPATLPTLQSLLSPHTSSPSLPHLGEPCASQCDNGGISGSTRCKHSVPLQVNPNGEILGICKLNTGFTGCTSDVDCYSFIDICNSGICTPRASTASDNHANGGNTLSQSQGLGIATNLHHFPAAAAVNNNENVIGEDQQVERKGSFIGRTLNIPISTGAQIVIALFAAIAICGTLVKCVMVIRQHKDRSHSKKPSRADMTDYGVELNVDWRINPKREQYDKFDVDSEMPPVSDRDYDADPYSSTEEFMLE